MPDTDVPEISFRALADAPRGGTVIEVRHGPDQEIVLVRWFAQTQAWIRDGDPYRRTLHRVTGWRPATEEQIAEANERRQAVAAIVNPVPEPRAATAANTATRIVKARKPKPR